MGINTKTRQSTYPKPPDAVVTNSLPAAATTIPTGDKGRRKRVMIVEVGGRGRSELTANKNRGPVRPNDFVNSYRNHVVLVCES